MGRKSRKPSEQRAACATIFFSLVVKGGEEGEPLELELGPELELEPGDGAFEDERVLERSSVKAPCVMCCTRVADGSEEAGRVVERE